MKKHKKMKAKKPKMMASVTAVMPGKPMDIAKKVSDKVTTTTKSRM